MVKPYNPFYCRGVAATFNGPLAQWLEQSTHNRLVVGSNPTRPTMHVDRASERNGLQNHLCRERYPGRAPIYNNERRHTFDKNT